MKALRAVFSQPDACEHVPSGPPSPAADHCQECGSSINLRLYSMPAGSGFIWCYVERRYVG